MRIGVPTEIKSAERRVGLTPDSVGELVSRGHSVTVESGAGDGIGADDAAYRAAGADIEASAAAVWDAAEMVVKVKEPQAGERAMLRADHVLFTYLHLAPDPDQTRDLVASRATCIAYETVTDDRGTLPLLMPMSQVAGRLAVQAGARCLEMAAGGSGVLLGGVPGVSPAHTIVIGGGVVGENAIEMATGLGSRVTVVDRDLGVLRRLAARFGPGVETRFATRAALGEVADADLVIGAVLVRGDKAPHVVSAAMVAQMRPGSVLVDVAIDQGGCFETSRPTTHTDPTYVVDGVVHYCVANMPGAVPRTSTLALNNATLPFVVALADAGPLHAMVADPHLRAGLNVCDGVVTEPNVARAHGLTHTDPLDAVRACLDRVTARS